MEILIPLALFAMITAIVIGPRYFRSLERQKLQETMRAAIDKGQTIPPEVISAITADVAPAKPPSSPQRDLRRGVIWLAIAIGLVVAGLIIGVAEPDSTFHFLGIATIPGVLGGAFLTLYFLGRNKV
ncbi:DUF6249 domain-containing protein [Phenylobacterium immobile]|uniref:DUF6249 domain-containing protein n=1 Tax=Phenylobacterium immobile TaxID=21 RepID=UPI000A41EFA2|nr:DUF6249 domain-containing protein [Phenylobacterium immobile]